MLMDSTGTVQRRYDYLPFGTELLSATDGRSTGYSSSPDDVGPKFTSQSRDQESTLDWFNVRDFSATQGRFQSVDPGNAGADPSNPETWNMYAYVANNPLSYTDPSGMFIEAAGPGSAAGPVGTIIGGLIDLGELFGALFGIFGGGCHTPSLANVSFPNQFPSAGPSGGPLGPSDNSGGGSAGSFTFGFTDQSDEQAWEQISFFCHYYNIGCSAAEIAIMKAGGHDRLGLDCGSAGDAWFCAGPWISKGRWPVSCWLAGPDSCSARGRDRLFAAVDPGTRYRRYPLGLIRVSAAASLEADRCNSR